MWGSVTCREEDCGMKGKRVEGGKGAEEGGGGDSGIQMEKVLREGEQCQRTEKWREMVIDMKRK